MHLERHLGAESGEHGHLTPKHDANLAPSAPVHRPARPSPKRGRRSALGRARRLGFEAPRPALRATGARRPLAEHDRP